MSARDEILSKIDIVEVISSYIDLKRVGSNYSARCPFHPDDTPSFYVSPSKGIFKCFGCGVGGDAIKFVSLYENISYTEALIKLAKKYNIPIKLKEKKNTKALDIVAWFYHENLPNSQEATSYLKKRGISSRAIKKFMLGYAYGHSVVDMLKKEGLLEEYEKTGNIVRIDKDIYRDIFSGRLIIPIRDEKGNCVAFGGRVIGDGHPKYINSPESEFFKKRETLFGLYESKDHIREKGYAIVVEGYFDVISMHDEGFKNVVAPLGTALGEYHAKLLSSFAKEVLLLFDGDEAGRKAVKSAVPHLLRHNLKVKVAYLPSGEDPDSLAKKDREKLSSLISSAREVFETLFEELKEGNKEALKEVIHFAGFIRDKIHQHEVLKEVSNITKMPLSLLYEQLPKVVEKQEEEEDKDITYAERVFLKGLMHLKRVEDLKYVLLSPKAMRIAEHILSGDYHLVPDSIRYGNLENLETLYLESLEKLKVSLEPQEKKEFVRFRRRAV